MLNTVLFHIFSQRLSLLCFLFYSFFLNILIKKFCHSVTYFGVQCSKVICPVTEPVQALGTPGQLPSPVLTVIMFSTVYTSRIGPLSCHLLLFFLIGKIISLYTPIHFCSCFFCGFRILWSFRLEDGFTEGSISETWA